MKRQCSFKELKTNKTTSSTEYLSVKLALLADSATQYLSQALTGAGINGNLKVSVFEGPYQQIDQQISDPGSSLYSYRPEYTVLFESSEHLLDTMYSEPAGKRNEFAEAHIEHVKALWSKINDNHKCTILHPNYVEIHDNIFGCYGNKLPQSSIYQFRKLNIMLMEAAQSYPNVLICDIAGLQNEIGRETFFDPRLYISSKMVLSFKAIPLVAEELIDIIRATKGKFNKCLILDLDNTLWGGVIGDDGIGKIEIGDLGVGKAFTEMQCWAKELKERGIILAVCSKNFEATSKEPFEKHPDMKLTLSDISIFVANWETKVENIKYIQQILNIGFDSMVFVDDNSFERNIVREFLPDVTVPELPEDPVYYVPYLRSLNLFETASYSVNDHERTKQYQAEADRTKEREKFTSLGEYLKSLEMKADIKPFDDFTLPRIAQLTQRSNQFNLRTVRYSEADIGRIKTSSAYAHFSISLEDKYGKYGLISVLILERRESSTLFIDTWIMSCRVLNRTVEQLALKTILKYAKENKYSIVLGEYISTAKNSLVKDHYSSLGFIEENGLWVLDLQHSDVNPETFIKENSNDL
jgi:FkbH-like protein